MKIVVLEPLGIPGEVMEGLSHPLTEKGHEFIACDSRT